MGLGMSDAAWLRRYARGVRLAARREGNPRRAAKMEDTCQRLEAAARSLEAAAGGRVAFADYARVDEVAERLRIHPESARRLMRQGVLPAVRVGNLWLMPRAGLDVAVVEYRDGRSRGRLELLEGNQTSGGL